MQEFFFAIEENIRIVFKTVPMVGKGKRVRRLSDSLNGLKIIEILPFAWTTEELNARAKA